MEYSLPYDRDVVFDDLGHPILPRQFTREHAFELFRESDRRRQAASGRIGPAVESTTAPESVASASLPSTETPATPLTEAPVHLSPLS